MIQIRNNFVAPPRDFTAEVVPKIGALIAAHEAGARFLALPVIDVPTSAAWILACFYSGVTAVPLPADLPEPVLADRLAQIPADQTVFPEHLKLQKPKAALLEPRPLHEIWAVIFTSGSSGLPKGAAISGAALKASAEMHAAHSNAEKVPWLLNLPLYHVGGLSVLSRSLFLQSEMAFGEPKFNSASTANWIRSGNVGGLSLVPTTLARLLREPELSFKSISIILLGGAPANDDLLALAREKGAPIRLTYGMTEASSQIATERSSNAGLEPLPGVELRIDEKGEIFVKSPALANGYFQGGRLTSLPLLNGFFPTGDLGALSASRLTLIGRSSDMIISGGKKIFPAEVEGILIENAALLDCAIIGVPNPEWGEILCAVYVAKPDLSFSPEEERARLLKRLEPHKIPKRWVALDKIPRTSLGKIDKSALREAISSRN